MNAVEPCNEPDEGYVNDWRGVTTLVNVLVPRKLYWTMRKLWAGKGRDPFLFPSCEQMLATGCSLTTPHASIWMPEVTGEVQGADLCNAGGSCVTDHNFCGPGSDTRVATPCCKCEPGLSGDACQTYDARVFVAFGAGGMLSLLLLLMVLMCVGHYLYRYLHRTCRTSSGLRELLLSG